MSERTVVTALYHFFDFRDYVERRSEIHAELCKLGIKGSLLIAPEGLNGTLAGSKQSIEALHRYLREEIIGGDFISKESECDKPPFARTKVRLKKEVISLGEPVNPVERTGTYVAPGNWNALITEPGITIIDARNSYEIHLGTFQGALDPATRRFSQLPDYVRTHLEPTRNRRVATFCTGGIRCEKFSAWLLDQGFEEVFQLKGGILKYLEEIPASESTWEGECYVFDDRVAVGHGLIPSQTSTLCPACGHSLTEQDRAEPAYQKDVRCPHCEREKSDHRGNLVPGYEG